MIAASAKKQAPRLQRLRQLGTRQLTRAHLAVAQRPALGEAARAALEMLAQLLSQELDGTVELEGRLSECSLPLSSLSRTAGFALLELSPFGATAIVEVELALLGAVLERLSGGPGHLLPVGRLTRIEEAAFSYLCLLALSALRRSAEVERLFGPRLVSVTASREELFEHTSLVSRVPATQRWVAVETQVTFNERRLGSVRVMLPSRVLQTAAQSEPPPPRTEAVPTGSLASSHLHARARLARTSVQRDDLANLEPGDVLVLERVSRQDNALTGDLRLVSRTFELHGHLAAEGFIFHDARLRVAHPELTMSNEATEVTVAALPIEVEVELTRIRLALGELAALRPGTLLPLHINAAEPVVLRVGERAIARAELVDIEGEVGARILSLVP